MKQRQQFAGLSDSIVLGLFGAGGFAREVMPVAHEYRQMLQQLKPETTVKLFFVDVDPQQTTLNDLPLIAEDDFFHIICKEKLFNIAIGDSKLREKIAVNCLKNGAIPHTLRSSNSVIYDKNEIGEGAIICAYSTITSNAKIGSFFHSNIYSYVAHDCVIGNYVTFAPNVHCNGNILIHDHAYIGTGAIIRQGSPDKPLVIGEGAVIGMGAVVTKDVEPYTTVIGNPARLYKKT